MRMKVAFLLIAVLCLTLTPLGAFAQEEEENMMVAIIVLVPEGWDSPCLWAWADNGTNAFAAWPGEEMDALPGREDALWYYCYVPDFVQNVIVNANGGTVQTEAVPVEAGATSWITIGEDLSTQVSTEALTDGEIPAYVERFTVHAYVPLRWKSVNLWACRDDFDLFPGTTMKAMREEDNGWFSGKLPIWVNRLVLSGNDGAEQTEDVHVEARELWITVYNDLSWEVAYEDPDKAVEDVTVHAQVPEDWSTPCCWAWSAPDGTNAFSAWPGEPMTQDGTWYTIQVPGWINSVIINANEGSVQTADLSVEPGKELWVVVRAAEDAQVTYEAPAE